MNIVAQLIEQIDARIAELEPLVAEFHELTRVRAEIVPGGDAAAAPAVAPARSAPASAAGGNAREQRALAIVAERPGITAAELGEALGGDAAEVYRVLPGLMRTGEVRKQGDGYHPA